MTLYLQLRNRITKYISLRSYALSVIEFAEKFDANMDRAGEALAQADDERSAVFRNYVEGEYQEALDMLESALGNLERVSELALEAKDEALFWVYVIEWFTVSGTGMMCGVLLWTLMVRRSAYKEVRTTRLRERQ